MKIKSKKGFTVVELVIVIAVVAILSSIMIPTFSGVIKKAENSAFVSGGKGRYREMLVETVGAHYDCFYCKDGRYLLFSGGGESKILGKHDGAAFSENDEGYELVAAENAIGTIIRKDGKEYPNIEWVIANADNMSASGGETDGGSQGGGNGEGGGETPTLLSCVAYVDENKTEITDKSSETELKTALDEIITTQPTAETTWDYVWYADKELTVEIDASNSETVYNGKTFYLGIKTKEECFTVDGMGKLFFNIENTDIEIATKIVIPALVGEKEVKSLDDSMYDGAVNKFVFLQELRINAAVEIPASFLQEVNTLETVYLCNEITTIGATAFSGCLNLKTVVAPGVTSFGDRAFEKCRSTLSVYTGEETLSSYWNAYADDDDPDSLKFSVYTKSQWEYVGSVAKVKAAQA